MVNKVCYDSMVKMAKIFNTKAAQRGSSMLMEIGTSGDLLTKTITRNGIKRTSFFDLNGTFLGNGIHSQRGGYNSYIGNGYRLESVWLDNPINSLKRVSLTNGERSTYAEARKFYDDGLEWKGIEGTYDDLVAYVRKTGDGKVTQNSWSKGKGLQDFDLQEERTSMGLARAKLTAKDALSRECYYSTSYGQQNAFDTQIKNTIKEIYNA